MSQLAETLARLAGLRARGLSSGTAEAVPELAQGPVVCPVPGLPREREEVGVDS
jgi:hypothetical protein